MTPGVNDGWGTGGAGATQAELIAFQAATGILDALGRKPFQPGYRMVGPGLWAKVSNSETPVDPSGFRFYSAQKFPVRDDGSITGTPGADIWSPFWIFKYWAQALCGESSANFTSGAGVFGSFSQAVSDLDAVTGAGWPLMFRNFSTTSPDRLAAEFMKQAPIAIWRSAATNKWMGQVYQRGLGGAAEFKDADGIPYPWSLERDVIGKPSFSWTMVEDCANEVHVHWAQYAPTGTFTRDTLISSTTSDDGYGALFDASRQAVCAESESLYHIRGRIDVEAPTITQKAQAAALCQHLVDRLNRPRMVVSWETWGIGSTIEPNMVTSLDVDWATRFPVPVYPSVSAGGRKPLWSQVPFRVARVDRSGTQLGDRHRITLEEIL